MEQETNQKQFGQSKQKSEEVKKLIFIGIISSILGALIISGVIFVSNNSCLKEQKNLSEEIFALKMKYP